MKRCLECKNVYPLDLFERFEDCCIGCRDNPHPWFTKPVPTPQPVTEWREWDTVGKCQVLFFRKPKLATLKSD